MCTHNIFFHGEFNKKNYLSKNPAYLELRQYYVYRPLLTLELVVKWTS